MIDNKVELIKKNMDEIMKVLEIEPTESNSLTSLRIAKMYVNELFKNRNNKNLDSLASVMRVLENVDDVKSMVIIEQIDFSSTCEHHFLPFSGIINFGYIPNRKIIGLSKVPRVVKYFSKKPQLQERLVKEIGEFLYALIDPKFLIVEAIATHDCVMCRGIESKCSTGTLFKQGEYLDQDSLSQEFFSRLKGGVSSNETKTS